MTAESDENSTNCQRFFKKLNIVFVMDQPTGM